MNIYNTRTFVDKWQMEECVEDREIAQVSSRSGTDIYVSTIIESEKYVVEVAQVAFASITFGCGVYV